MKFHNSASIAVVIPAYRVRENILRVIHSLQGRVDFVCVVDDACPESSGTLVVDSIADKSVHVIFNKKNLGVGGAVKAGYRFCLDKGFDFIIKMDGDGQMQAELIPKLLEPLINQQADYTKGNRFFSLASLKKMPKIRLLGNAILSLMSKAASGYWNILDPNNGFTAIDSRSLKTLDLNRISNRYFFESDMLFHLYLLRARVIDIPMMAKYGDERSNLSLFKAALEFPAKHIRNFVRRLVATYFIRDFSIASLQLILGVSLIVFSSVFGIFKYMQSQSLGIETNSGALILFAVTFLVGIQMLLAFLSFDFQNMPKRPISGEFN